MHCDSWNLTINIYFLRSQERNGAIGMVNQSSCIPKKVSKEGSEGKEILPRLLVASRNELSCQSWNLPFVYIRKDSTQYWSYYEDLIPYSQRVRGSLKVV